MKTEKVTKVSLELTKGELNVLINIIDTAYERASDNDKEHEADILGELLSILNK